MQVLLLLQLSFVFVPCMLVEASSSPYERYKVAYQARIKLDKAYGHEGKVPPHEFNPRHRIHAPLVDAFTTFAREQVGALEKFGDPHLLVSAFCAASDDVDCEVMEINLLINAAIDILNVSLDSIPDDNPGATYFNEIPSECPRVHVDQLNRTRFLEDFVNPSRPVIIEGAVNGWRAKDMWQDEQYLLDKAGDSMVRIFIVPRDPDGVGSFEAVRRLSKEELLTGMDLHGYGPPEKERAASMTKDVKDVEEWSKVLARSLPLSFTASLRRLGAKS